MVAASAIVAPAVPYHSKMHRPAAPQQLELTYKRPLEERSRRGAVSSLKSLFEIRSARGRDRTSEGVQNP
eukprot:3092153-Pyramimonas_sp.AAC.1